MRTSLGNEFHNSGAATLNARSPRVSLFVLGTTSDKSSGGLNTQWMILGAYTFVESLKENVQFGSWKLRTATGVQTNGDNQQFDPSKGSERPERTQAGLIRCETFTVAIKSPIILPRLSCPG